MEPTEVVRARRIEILDAEGVVRAVLGTHSDDEADTHPSFVTLYDLEGVERVSLSCETDAASLELLDGGNVVAALSFGHGRGARLSFPEAS